MEVYVFVMIFLKFILIFFYPLKKAIYQICGEGAIFKNNWSIVHGVNELPI